MFNKIFINRAVYEDSGSITEKFPAAELIVVENDEEIFHYIKDPREGKKALYLAKLAGNFVKSCPGTDKSYICCQYYVINEMTNCPLDCSYCILQFYLDLPVITYYLNIDKMFDELAALSAKFPQRVIRIGTGELTDSLALDSLFHTNAGIIKKLDELPNIIFEVKTKTGKVDHLFEFIHPRLIFSWSVNPEEIIKTEEHLTSSLAVRLKAMAKIADSEAKIGLHFDPIIYYEGWETGYENLIGKLGETVPANKIAWISMGSFRHPADLRYKILENHPNSNLLTGESITGTDGKSRYPKGLRRKMYRKIFGLLRKHFGEDVFVYFCMESPQMWKDVMGDVPRSNEDLDYRFAVSLYEKFQDMKLPFPEIKNYPSDW